MRHVSQLLDGLVDLEPERLEHLALALAIELLAREGEVDPQRDQPLLRAVVQVAFNAPPLG